MLGNVVEAVATGMRLVVIPDIDRGTATMAFGHTWSLASRATFLPNTKLHAS